MNTGIFNEKIKQKKQLLFVIEDEKREKFGYHLNTKVKNEYNNKYYSYTDNK